MVFKNREAATKVFYEKGVRNFAKSEENTCAIVSFLIKLKA